MSDPMTVAAAEARVAAARERLATTIAALQTRLDPRAVAREAVAEISDSSSIALRSGVETARRHPVETAGAATLVLVLLARRRIRRLFSRKPKAQPASSEIVLIETNPAAAPARREA